MKKSILIAALIAFNLALASCGGSQQVEPTTTISKDTCIDTIVPAAAASQTVTVSTKPGPDKGNTAPEVVIRAARK